MNKVPSFSAIHVVWIKKSRESKPHFSWLHNIINITSLSVAPSSHPSCFLFSFLGTQKFHDVASDVLHCRVPVCGAHPAYLGAGINSLFKQRGPPASMGD